MCKTKRTCRKLSKQGSLHMSSIDTVDFDFKDCGYQYTFVVKHV